ncbi:MAG: tetratricopeptide repeat protein [Planctomycetota bacterium]
MRQRGAAPRRRRRPHPAGGGGRALADNLPDEALSCFEAALAADPQDTLAALGRGDSLCALGRWPEAHDAFRALSEAQPTCVDAWVGRGACLSLLERHAEAIEVFDHALTLDPENPGRLRGMRDMAQRMLETQR